MDDRRGKRGMRSRNTERSEDEKAARASAVLAPSGGGIFKSAAVAVLRQHRKLMTTGDITRLAVDMDLLKCQGKTPEATMASALYTDVKRKLQKSLFTRPQEGLFGLREWLDEGYYPEGWVGPPDGLGLAPFKRRNAANMQGTGSGSIILSKAARPGVRTGPGRSSKSRARSSWRSAASDGEDDDLLNDEDEHPLYGRSAHGSSGTGLAGIYGGSHGAGGEDEDMDDVGEGEEVDVEDDVDEDGDWVGDGQDELGRQGTDDTDGGPDGLPTAGGSRDIGNGLGGGGARGCGLPGATSPGISSGRRGGKVRGGGGGHEGAAAQDECLSPLHMLGEAAASESLDDLTADHYGPPPAKRRRPCSITVPERGGGLGGVENITPKSPYEDSLAALHEIATSPSTFDLTAPREHRGDREGGGMGGGGGGGGKVGRNRPRLHVDVPSHGTDLGSGLGSRRDGGTPGTALLTDNPMLQGETTPAILLQASPVTTVNGQQAMMLRQAPVLVTLPAALASPTGVAGGQLDTPALLHVQLPGGAPSELMQTTLITPTGQPLTPPRPLMGGGLPSARGGLLKADGGLPSTRGPGRRVSFSGEVGILGPPSSVPHHQPLQPAAHAVAHPAQGGGAAASQTWPPRLTPAQVESELVEINRVQTVVERLESKLGNTHPQVGKAWLALSRMYQHIAEAERHHGASGISNMAKAAEAVRRAWAACRACAESCGTSVICEDAFRYLTARTNEAGMELEPPAATVAAVPQAANGEPGVGDKERGDIWSLSLERGEGRGQGQGAISSEQCDGSPDGGIEGGQQQHHKVEQRPGLDVGVVEIVSGGEGQQQQPVVAVQG